MTQAQMDMRTKPLPGGWKWVKLGDAITVIRGVSFKQGDASATAQDGTVPILRAGNISDRLNTTEDLLWVPHHLVSNEQKLLVNDIVICLSLRWTRKFGQVAK